ncbi:hypothetical protein E8A74_46410 [Polyangium fumosum]|uniref:Uncharacterized protein n=2 Tax=Polyangium fumosum TaxID=889272 RepID=A0A4V5PLA5_9BACT|nr:hypothetical protein E8A74_46410 [Polyangium fumosum]
MPGYFMKGALVQLAKKGPIPVPNLIMFQYNPETIEHTWDQPDGGGGGSKPGSYSNPQAASGKPGESFSFTLQMDANDQIAEGSRIAAISGVYTRLAALEMLIFPVEVKEELVGATGAKNACEVPQFLLPTVLFVWGPGRILPVRVTSLSVTEKLFDKILNPTQVEAKIGLRVLTPEELAVADQAHDPLAKVGMVAYSYSHGLRQALAIANLANAKGDVGMLPF